MRRSFVSLLTALSFSVLAITGVLAFVRPFSVQIIGLHALMGFVFILLVGLHVLNNMTRMKEYLQTKALWITLTMTTALTAVLLLQLPPVKALLGLSANLGPALDRFEMNSDEIVYHYSPTDHYKMALTIKAGKAYNTQKPPQLAIWLENQAAHHFKTLHRPKKLQPEMLPYWTYKVKGWQKAKQKAEAGVDAATTATPTGSFDPADYVLPADPDKPMPYQLLIEINQGEDANASYDDQPSLVYTVEINNVLPQTYQLLELMGYTKREDNDNEEKWAVYYADERLSSSLRLIDSVLLTIDRSEP